LLPRVTFKTGYLFTRLVSILCVITDTEKIYEKIIEDLAKSYGKPYPWDVRMRILGTTERRTCEIAVKELGLPCTVQKFHEQYKQSCVTHLANVYLLKGSL